LAGAAVEVFDDLILPGTVLTEDGGDGGHKRPLSLTKVSLRSLRGGIFFSFLKKS